MAPKRERGANYALPHIRIERFRQEAPYSPPPRAIEREPRKVNNVAHGRSLGRQLSAAYAKARAVIAERRILEGHSSPGVYLEVSSNKDEPLGDVSWEQKGIRLGALRLDEDSVQRAAVFVPEKSQEFVSSRLDRYATAVNEGKQPSLADRFDTMGSITNGTLHSLWTDSRPLPIEEDGKVWWECWTWKDGIEVLGQVARRLDLQVSARRLVFPEVDVIPVHATVAELERLVFQTGVVEQIRNANDNPSFFTEVIPREQSPWVEDLAGRISPPQPDSPAVCILDTGIAQAHPLISLALSTSDCLSVNTTWGTADDSGHGTRMAGTVLYEDLTYPLTDRRQIDLDFCLESVKFLPPDGYEATDPKNYGSITQAAISTAEINAPERSRVFCMAVTNKDISGERPTSWSAAIDQIASGSMVGDRENEDLVGPRRLIVVSGGNIPDTSDPDEVSDIDEFPVEDPAQAWNALTVGGFTEKTEIDPVDGYPDWTAVAKAGDLSPYSRISTDWNHSLTAIKPEIVFEAGNKAMSPEKTEILSGLDSLSLLTTNNDFNKQNLTTFWATSPATAQAAGMAGALTARFPEFWPETVRALMIHSAEWTPRMLSKLSATALKHEKVILARHFGYGVPSLDRAVASAENDLVLLAQQMMTPYHRRREADTDGRETLKSPSFRQVDYYDLPWPVSTLEQLGEEEVTLKVTLSYFIEPNPNWDAALAPQRYQSFGLRFDLKRATEGEREFRERINNLERNAEPRQRAVPDEGWTFGAQSIAAGSLHCDVWRGTAAKLASRNKLAVFPIGGWWRDRLKLRRYSSQTRYALTVSISSRTEDVKLYSEIANRISLNV